MHPVLALRLSDLRHPSAIVETHAIGAGTRIEAFAHILAGARLGANARERIRQAFSEGRFLRAFQQVLSIPDPAHP